MAKNEAKIVLSAEDRTRAAFASARRNFSDLQRQADQTRNVLAGLGGAISVGAVVAFTRQSIASAAALDDLAEATGGSVEGLSKLVDIARISGGGLETVQTTLLALNKALLNPQAEENKGVGAALQAIGLSAKDLLALEPDKRIELVAKTLAEFADSGDKASVILTIFKKSAAEVGPYLKDIAENLDRSSSVTAEQAAQAEKLEKQFRALAIEASNVGREIALGVVPALSQFFTLMREGGGFGGAVNAMLARIGTNKSIGEQIKELTAELDALEKRRTTPGTIFSGGIAGAASGVRESGIQRTIASLKVLQREQALAGAGADALDARDLRLRQPKLLSFKGGADEASKAARAAGLSEGERLIRQLQDEIAKKDDLTRVEEILRAVQEKRLVFLNASEQSRALALAGVLDEVAAKKRLAEAEKDYAEGVKSILGPLQEEAEKLQKQVREHGKTETEIRAVIAAENEHAASIAALNGALPEHIDFLKRVAEANRGIAEAADAAAAQSFVDQFTEGGKLDAFQRKIDEINRLEFSGLLTAAQSDEIIARFNGMSGAAKKNADDMGEFAREAARNMQDAFADGFFNIMQGKFDDLGSNFKATIDRMVANVLAAQLAEKLFGEFGKTGEIGGLAGEALTFFRGLFGGGRAHGGPVEAGRLYEVNERGAPEILSVGGRDFLMMGGQRGAVTASGSGNGTTVQNNFYVTGPVDRRSQGQIAAAAGAGVRRAMARNT